MSAEAPVLALVMLMLVGAMLGVICWLIIDTIFEEWIFPALYRWLARRRGLTVSQVEALRDIQKGWKRGH